MYTILGAGGSIANETAKVLTENKIPFTLVGRHPASIYGAPVKSADLTNASQVMEAVKGSSIALLCPGLTYDFRIWNEKWPVIMSNTISACKYHQVKLIFFDNVYALGKVNGKMTEDSPMNPSSKKGELRAKMVSQLADEVKAGNLKAIIARSADFYGPNCKTSFLNILVCDKMKNGKKAQWLVNDNLPHSFTFTPDCGKALYLLSQQDSAWNQTWHMPTAAPALTGKEFIEIASKIFNTTSKHVVLGKGMIALMGIFSRTIYELKEMLYQNDSDYVFDSAKFNQAFNFTPTSYEEGIKTVAASYIDK